MISKSNVKLYCMRCCVCPYFLQNNVIIKQLLDSVFVNIQNNQGLGVPLALLITVSSTMIISDVTKPHPIIVYCMTGSANGQDKANDLLTLEWKASLARSGFAALFLQQTFLIINVCNPSLIKLVRSRRLDIGLVHIELSLKIFQTHKSPKS